MNKSQPVRQWRKRCWNWDATLRCLYSVCSRSVFLSSLRWFLCYFHSSASLSSGCRKHVNQALCISLNHTCAMWRADFKDVAGIITPIFHFEYFMASYFNNKRCSCGWYLLKTDNLAFSVFAGTFSDQIQVSGRLLENIPPCPMFNMTPIPPQSITNWRNTLRELKPLTIRSFTYIFWGICSTVYIIYTVYSQQEYKVTLYSRLLDDQRPLDLFFGGQNPLEIQNITQL